MADEPTKPESRLPLDEAEDVLDDLLARVRDAARRTVALAREEAEDIWAEAQDMRRGGQKTR